MRFVLGLTFLASFLTHTAWLNPIRSTSDFEVKDNDGEVDIAVDLFEEAPPQPVKTGDQKPQQGDGLDGGSEAGIADGSVDASATKKADGGSDAGRDGGSGPVDASTDAMGDAAPIASSPPDNGPKDSLGIVGTAGAIKAANVYVTVSVNAEAIRKNSVGKRSGALLQGIGQWKTFLAGTNIDPVRDAEWVLIEGPSLVDTTKAVITIRYNLKDEQMDAACAMMAERYKDKGGGPYETGIPGMKAWLAFADKGERILVRPQSHMLVILPSRKTVSPEKEKQLLKKIGQTVYPAKLKNANEAVRVILKEPNHAISKIPVGLSEVRLRTIPGAHDDATIFIEGDCKNETECAKAHQELEDTLGGLGSLAGLGSLVGSIRPGMVKVINQVQLSHDSKHVRFELTLSRDDLQELLTFMQSFIKNGRY